MRRLEEAGWYKSFPHIPYFPMYFNGNGAVPRKLEDNARVTMRGANADGKCGLCMGLWRGPRLA